MPGGILTSRNIMRIVTRDAFQFAATLVVTARLQETVSPAHPFEPILASAAGRIIEENRVIHQGLSGNISEGAAIESLYHCRNFPACRFQMALQAHLNAARGIQFRRIYYASPA